MNEQQFIEALRAHGIELTDHQLAQFEMYYETLVEWNEKMNLTAITDKEEVYLKHFYDSISAAFYVDYKGEHTLCDVGAGAGFPSIPLKICYPQLDVTIVDSLKKRMTFLDHLAEKLELENVRFIHARAEEFGQDKAHREQYDLVMARAVARLSVLSEYCIPLVRVGGQFIAMKGAAGMDEYKDAKGAIRKLGGRLREEHLFQLPKEESERYIMKIDKIKATPKKSPLK